MLFQCHGITGIFTRQVGAHANPSRRREAVSAGQRNARVAVAGEPCGIGNLAGDRIAAAIKGGEMCPAGVNIADVAVVDVGQYLPVIAELWIGCGVGIGLDVLQPIGGVQREQHHPPLGLAPSTGILLQIVPALERRTGRSHLHSALGRRHPQRGKAQPTGGAIPVVVDCFPVIKSLGGSKGPGGDHRLVGDKQEGGHKFDSHFALDPQGLTVDLALCLVGKIGAGKELILTVHIQIAE